MGPSFDTDGVRSRAHTGRWTFLIAGFITAVAVAVCFHRLTLEPAGILVGPQDDGRTDLTNQIIAFRSFAGWSLRRDGGLPTWNPYGFLGIPWWGNPQTGLIYPGNWIYLLLPGATAASWIMIVHHWWAGLGTFALTRSYGLSTASCLLAAVAYAAAPYYVANTAEGHYNPALLVAWVPWAFLVFEQLRAGRRGSIPLLAGIFALCFFCGHVQEVYYLILIQTGLVAYDVIRNKGKLLTRMQLIQRWTVTGMATAGLVAFELFPIWAYTRQAVRSGGIDLAQATADSLTWASLVQMIDPFVWGGPENFSGPGTFYWETLAYVGIVTLLAAACALVDLRNPRVPQWIVITGLAFLFAFGQHSPLFVLMHRYLPGVSFFRSPARSMIFVAFGLAILNGFGLEAIRRRFDIPKSDVHQYPTRRRTYCIVGGIALLIACGLHGITMTAPAISSPPVSFKTLSVFDSLQRANWQQAAAWLLSGVGALAFVAAGVRRAEWACYGVSLVLLLELTTHAHSVTRVIPPDNVREQNPIIEQILASQPTGRVLAPQLLISDREAWRDGIKKLQTYDPVPLSRFGIVMAAAVTPARDPAMEMTGFYPLDPTVYRDTMLDLLHVEFAVVAHHMQEAPKGWDIFGQGKIPDEYTLKGISPRQRTYTILRRKQVIPAAYAIGSVTPARGDDPVEQLKRINCRETVLLEQDILATSERCTFSPATIRQESTTRKRIDIELNAPGYLVLSEIFYSGWSATSNGQSLPVLPANFAIQAVPLPAGKHTVELSYTPPMSGLGLIISLMTVSLLAVSQMSGQSPRDLRKPTETPRERDEC